MEWTETLISDIISMRGRELPAITADAIIAFFLKIGEKDSRRIVSRISGFENIPSNILGIIKKEHGNIMAEEREKTSWKERHDEGMGTNSECSALMLFNQELFLWHQLELVERNTEGFSGSVDIDTYIKMERPKTWSPILDHWLYGFETAYFLDMREPGALLNYLLQYNATLKKQREERSNK